MGTNLQPHVLVHGRGFEAIGLRRLKNIGKFQSWLNRPPSYPPPNLRRVPFHANHTVLSYCSAFLRPVRIPVPAAARIGISDLLARPSIVGTVSRSGRLTSGGRSHQWHGRFGTSSRLRGRRRHIATRWQRDRCGGRRRLRRSSRGSVLRQYRWWWLPRRTFCGWSRRLP